MYTFELPICIPKMLCGESVSGQHPKVKQVQVCCASKSTVSLGSFSGGFSSTAGYVPGNEAHSSEEHERRSIRWLIISKADVAWFLSLATRVDPRMTLASLSASAPGVCGQRLSAPSVLERRVATSVPPPGAGQNARKQS